MAPEPSWTTRCHTEYHHCHQRTPQTQDTDTPDTKANIHILKIARMSLTTRQLYPITHLCCHLQFQHLALHVLVVNNLSFVLGHMAQNKV